MHFCSHWRAIAPAVAAILSLVLAACGGVIPTAVSTPAMADSGEAPRTPASAWPQPEILPRIA